MAQDRRIDDGMQDWHRIGPALLQDWEVGMDSQIRPELELDWRIGDGLADW